MSVFNRMPAVFRTYCVVMAVVALFSVVIFGGRLLTAGTVFATEVDTTAVVKMEAPADTQVASAAAVVEDMSNYIADASKGKKVSGKCKACHTFDEGGKDKTGPNLWAIFGQGISNKAGFKYSAAFEAKKGEIVWNDEEMDAFLKKPKKYIEGTKMAFGGVKKEKDRLNLIAWLKTLQ